MPSFHFSKEPVTDQLIGDVQALNSLNGNQLGQLVDLLLDFLSGEEAIDIGESISAFCEENKLNSNQWKISSRGIIFFFRNAVKVNMSPLFVRDDLLAFGVGEERANLIAGQYKERFISLSRSVIDQTLNVNQLVDIEWKSGITVSSSDCGKVGTAFLQLKLVLDKGNNTFEDVYMELSLAQFYEFLREMQKAKSNLDFF